MSSHIGSVVVGVFPKEEKDDSDELGGPQMWSSKDPNFPLEQGKPRYI
jgi:hypothetical protein